MDAPKTVDGDAIDHYLLWTSIEAHAQCYERLLEYDFRNNTLGTPGSDPDRLIGKLAESWEASPDGRSYAMKLHQGIRSYYGNELTADDVKWSWDRAFSLGSIGHWAAVVLGNVSSQDDVSVLDRYTLRFDLTDLAPLFLKSLHLWSPTIFDATEARRHSSADDPWAREWLDHNDAGFGPYHIELFVPGKEVVFVRNPNYYRGLPAFKQVTYRGVSDSAKRLELLLNGDVDIAEWLTPVERDAILRHPDLRVISTTEDQATNYLALGFNNTGKPFSAKAVRQAVAYAVPYDRIREEVYLSRAHEWRSFVPQAFPGYDDSAWKYHTNPEVARHLLAAAGFANGFSATLSFPADPRYRTEIEDVALLIRRALGDIGIRISLEKVEPWAFFRKRQVNHEYEFYLFQQAPFAAFDPGYPLPLYFGDYMSRYGEEGEDVVNVRKSPGNHANYFNPKVISLLKDARFEPDETKRIDLYRKVQSILLEELPMIPIALPGDHISMKADVKGYRWYIDHQIRFFDLGRE